MEKKIKAGSVVFHKPPEGLESYGRGVVLNVEWDKDLELEIYTVLWNVFNRPFEHFDFSLQAEPWEKSNGT